MTDLPWRPFPPKGARPIDGLPLGACVVAIGVFDGLHRGHQALLATAREDAQSRGIPLVALTFDPDPAEVVASEGQPSRLLSPADRISGLQAFGADEVVVLPFTQDLACLAPEDFVMRVVLARMRPVAIHVGSNFRFGHRGQGTPATLANLGRDHGFVVHAHDLLLDRGKVVSATRIRELLCDGSRIDEANMLLGRCHYVRGRVAHGRGEGTSFGFPTANVECDPRYRMPAEGVYACYVCMDEHAWPGAANVGAPPTFSRGRPAFLEVNLVGFSGDLYDAEVTVSFVAWLRPSRVFDSLDELERVVLGNIAWVREHLA